MRAQIGYSVSQRLSTQGSNGALLLPAALTFPVTPLPYREGMGRNTQFIRQWQILRKLVLHRYGCTVHRLAIDLEVSTRTIHRDLECLQAAGFPLYASLCEDGHRWKMRRDQAAHALVRLTQFDDATGDD
jgi:hypothetical protein